MVFIFDLFLTGAILMVWSAGCALVEARAAKDNTDSSLRYSAVYMDPAGQLAGGIPCSNVPNR
jgi:hypothetical protein